MEEQTGRDGWEWFSSLSQTGKAVVISSGIVAVAGVGHLLHRHFFSATKYCPFLVVLVTYFLN